MVPTSGPASHSECESGTGFGFTRTLTNNGINMCVLAYDPMVANMTDDDMSLF